MDPKLNLKAYANFEMMHNETCRCVLHMQMMVVSSTELFKVRALEQKALGGKLIGKVMHHRNLQQMHFTTIQFAIQYKTAETKNDQKRRQRVMMAPAGLEPATFSVLD